MSSIGRAEGEVYIGTGESVSNLRDLNGALDQVDKQGSQAFGNTDQSLKNMTGAMSDIAPAFIGIGGAMTAAFGVGIKSAYDFESAMSSVKAVAGATEEEFVALENAALRIGKESMFSATEAAGAIEELVKAGVSVTDVLNGAADGAVALAAAAGVDMPKAAEAMAASMNIFNLEGDQATRVANVFAAAANKSATDVHQLQLGLAQGGATFAMFGMSLEESVGALSLFSDYGLRGSDSATSLNAALRAMNSGVGESGAAMEELGISLYDAQGNFIGVEGVAGQLQAKLGSLGEEERNLYLQRLGGADGMRALNILYQEGEAGVAEYTAAVTGTNAAQDAAAARMDNLAGVIEEVRGSIETLGIMMTRRLLPAFRFVAEGVLAFLNILIDLPAPIQTVAAAVIGIVGVLTAAAGAAMLFAPQLLAMAQGFKALRDMGGVAGVIRKIMTATRANTAATSADTVANYANATSLRARFAAMKGGIKNIGGMRGALMGLARAHPVLTGITAAAGLIGIAYKTNFLGLKDTVQEVTGTIGLFADRFMDGFNRAGDEAAIAEDKVASFAEATDVVDGVTIYTAFRTNADGEKEKVGEIIESYANADGMTAQVLIKGDDGEYWATIDLATGEISNAEINVSANAGEAFTIFDRIRAGLTGLEATALEMGLGWMIPIIDGLRTATNAAETMWGVIQPIITTFRNQFASLNKIMNPLSAGLVAIARTLNTLDLGRFTGLARSLGDVFEGIGYAIQRFGQAGREVISMVAALWQGHFSDAAGHARNAINLITDGFSHLAAAADGVGAFASQVFAIAGKGAFDLAGKIPLVSDTLYALSQVFQGMGEVAAEAWGIVASIFRGDFDDAIDGVMDLISDLGDLAEDTLVFIGELVGDLAGILRKGLGKAVDWASDKWSGFSRTFETVGNVLDGVLGVIENVAEAFADLIKGDWRGFGRNMAEAFGSALKAVGNLLFLLPTLIFDAIAAINWGSLGTTLKNGFLSAFNGAGAALQGASDDVLGWIQDAADGFEWGNVGKTVVTGIVNGARAAASGAGDMFGWVRDAFENVLEGAGDAIDRGLELAWDALTSLNWADFVPPLAWDVITTLLEWGAFVADLAWGAWLTVLTWGTYIKDLIWSGFISFLDWAKDIIPDFGKWVDWVSELNWSGLGGIIPDFGAWTDWASELTWSGLGGIIPDFGAWLDWISKVKWTGEGGIIPAFGAWLDWINKVKWTGDGGIIPAFGEWLDYLTSWLPDIPDFPGWSTVFSWINPFDGDGDAGPPPDKGDSASDGVAEQLAWLAKNRPMTEVEVTGPNGEPIVVKPAPGEGGTPIEKTDRQRVEDGEILPGGFVNIDAPTGFTIDPEAWKRLAVSMTDTATASGKTNTQLTPLQRTWTNIIGSLTAGLPAFRQVDTGITNTVPAFGTFYGAARTAFAGANQAVTTNVNPLPRIVGSAAGGMLKSAAPSFSDILGSARNNFSGVSNATSSNMSVAQRAATSLSSLMASTVGRNTGSMAKDARGNAVTMNRGVTGEASTMGAGVGRTVTSMASGAISRFANMAREGRGKGQEMGTGLTRGAETGERGVRTVIGRVPGIISSIGGQAVRTAQGIGRDIGLGLVRGMESTLSQIRAIATEMVRTAENAVRRAAVIRSPSRLFAGLGQDTGQGYANGVANMIKAVASSGRSLVSALVDTLKGVAVDNLIGTLGRTLAGTTAGMARGGRAGAVPATGLNDPLRAQEFLMMMRGASDALTTLAREYTSPHVPYQGAGAAAGGDLTVNMPVTLIVQGAENPASVADQLVRVLEPISMQNRLRR